MDFDFIRWIPLMAGCVGGIFFIAVYIAFGALGSYFAVEYDFCSTTSIVTKLLLVLLPITTTPFMFFSICGFPQSKKILSIGFIGMIIATIISSSMLIVTATQFVDFDYQFNNDDRETFRKIEYEEECCFVIKEKMNGNKVEEAYVFKDCTYVKNGTVEIYPETCTNEFGEVICKVNLNHWKYLCEERVVEDKFIFIILMVCESIQTVDNIIVVLFIGFNLFYLVYEYYAYPELRDGSGGQIDEPEVTMKLVESKQEGDTTIPAIQVETDE